MHAECIDILDELESWYARENGRYLFEAARRATEEMLDTAFGYHILQMGISGELPLSGVSPINHRIYCAKRGGEGVGLVAVPDELPLESDSIDIVILHHCLEFARRPHSVLREVQRVLTPHGQLVIAGFNPYSILGLSTRARGVLRDPLWSQHNPLGEHRLTDWLHLLGCEVMEVRRLYGLPPVGRGRLRQWMSRCDAWIAEHNLPVGGLYLLHARKQVVGMHRIRRPLLARGAKLTGLVPKPSPTPAPVPVAPTGKTYRNFSKKDTAA